MRQAKSRDTNPLACLSMHQPWASLLVAGIKRIEGRTWSTNHRGRLWIHATSQTPNKGDIEVRKRLRWTKLPRVKRRTRGGVLMSPASAMIGKAKHISGRHSSLAGARGVVPTYSRAGGRAAYVPHLLPDQLPVGLRGCHRLLAGGSADAPAEHCLSLHNAKPSPAAMLVLSHQISCVPTQADDVLGWGGLPESLKMEALSPFCFLCEAPRRLVMPQAMRGHPKLWDLVSTDPTTHATTPMRTDAAASKPAAALLSSGHACSQGKKLAASLAPALRAPMGSASFTWAAFRGKPGANDQGDEAERRAAADGDKRQTRTVKAAVSGRGKAKLSTIALGNPFMALDQAGGDAE